jgi:hypothetical protein
MLETGGRACFLGHHLLLGLLGLCLGEFKGRGPFHSISGSVFLAEQMESIRAWSRGPGVVAVGLIPSVGTILDEIAEPVLLNTFSVGAGYLIVRARAVGFIAAVKAIGLAIALPGCRDALSAATYESVARATDFIIVAIVPAVANPAFRNTVTVRALEPIAWRAVLILVLSIGAISVSVANPASRNAGSIVTSEPIARTAVLLVLSAGAISVSVADPAFRNAGSVVASEPGTSWAVYFIFSSGAICFTIANP